MLVYGARIIIYYVYAPKHIAHVAICYNTPLVGDKPLGTPAFVERKGSNNYELVLDNSFLKIVMPGAAYIIIIALFSANSSYHEPMLFYLWIDMKWILSYLSPYLYLNWHRNQSFSQTGSLDSVVEGIQVGW